MTEQQHSLTIDHEALESFITTILERAGLRRSEAETVSEILTDADLKGIDTHGVLKVPEYTERIESGGMNPTPDITIERTRPSTRIIDGDGGPGQVVALEATQEAIDAAAQAGCGFVSVTNSNHFGVASYFTHYAAEQGYIGLCMTHAGQNVVPFGGVDPYFGTNPLAISFPRENNEPVSIDMSTSWKSKSRITLAEERGESIPEEWALNSSGAPTTDPSDVHALRPLGGPKGYGLAFAVEAFCGILGGTVFGDDVPSSYEGLDTPQQLSHFIGVIDVEAFAEFDDYAQRMETMIEELRATRTANDVNSVLLPGEPELQLKAEQRNSGIRFTEEDWKKLQNLANKYDVDKPPVDEDK